MATHIVCPACDTRYETKAVFPPEGRKVRCSKCGHVWQAHPVTVPPPAKPLQMNPPPPRAPSSNPAQVPPPPPPPPSSPAKPPQAPPPPTPAAAVNAGLSGFAGIAPVA